MTTFQDKKLINQLRLYSKNGGFTDSHFEESVYSHFLANSVITAAAAANPGTSVVTEFLYNGIPSPHRFDNLILNSKSGRAIKDRLNVITKELPRITKDYHISTGLNEISIGNFGSGPGRDTIELLSYLKRNPNGVKVRAYNIDKDCLSLQRGKRIAKLYDVGDQIEFVEGDFLKYKPAEKFDIVLLIGILCPLSIETCIDLLHIVKKSIKKNGLIIASNASKRMQEEDPFICFLMRWTANWNLVFKDEMQVMEIFQKAGYVWKESFTDSFGFNIMGVGEVS